MLGFKEIPNYSEYMISNKGEVYSVKSQRNLTWSYNHAGYPTVCLTINKKEYTRKVHKLVALTFLPNPKNLPQINHIDGDKLNNNVENLEWCTASHNRLHACRVLKVFVAGGLPPKKIKGTHLDTGEILIFNSTMDAERLGGFHHNAISKVCLGKAKHHKRFVWEFISAHGDNQV